MTVPFCSACGPCPTLQRAGAGCKNRAVLQAAGVDEAAISVIPDEQQAIDAALRMGQPGDLVLVFADALTRSWKQIIRFKPDGDMPKAAPRAEVPQLETTLDEQLVAAMEGVVRDERGLRFEREESD